MPLPSRRYLVRPAREVVACEGLRQTVLLAAQAALHYGGAGPAAVLAELGRAIGDLGTWWRRADGVLMERPEAQRKGTMR